MKRLFALLLLRAMRGCWCGRWMKTRIPSELGKRVEYLTKLIEKEVRPTQPARTSHLLTRAGPLLRCGAQLANEDAARQEEEKQEDKRGGKKISRAGPGSKRPMDDEGSGGSKRRRE